MLLNWWDKSVLNLAKLLNKKIKNSFHWTAMAIRGEESLLQVADSRNCYLPFMAFCSKWGQEISYNLFKEIETEFALKAE